MSKNYSRLKQSYQPSSQPSVAIERVDDADISDDDDYDDDGDEENNVDDESVLSDDDEIFYDDQSSLSSSSPPSPRSPSNAEQTTDPSATTDGRIQLDEFDSSDDEDIRNTIGNVPIQWYRDYDHVGYSLSGKPIKKTTTSEADEVDEFLSREMGEFSRLVRDRQTGEKIRLNEADLDAIRRLTVGSFISSAQPFAPWPDLYSSEKMKFPVTGRPLDKRQFIPSKWERLQVGKYVHAIKMGWLKPKQPLSQAAWRDQQERSIFDRKFYSVWSDDDVGETKRSRALQIPAPRMPLPGHEQSYNPPVEYLFSEEERKKWLQQDKDERKINFIPQRYSALRLVPAYKRLVNERFERCLDLYLCPRQRKMRMNVDPEDLLPQLPSSKDLQPFPSELALLYRGHTAAVNCISIDPSNQWLASSSDDGTVRFWEIATGRCMHVYETGQPVKWCAWNPSPSVALLLCSSANSLYLIVVNLGDRLVVQSSVILLQRAFSSTPTDSATGGRRPDESGDESDVDEKEDGVNSEDDDEADDSDKKKTTKSDSSTANSGCTWKALDKTSEESLPASRRRVGDNLWTGQIDIGPAAMSAVFVSWHPKGDYFASISNLAARSFVHVHHLTKAVSQAPFRRITGLVQRVVFHGAGKPWLFVATRTEIRMINLQKMDTVKRFRASMISDIQLHPSSDHLLVCSFDSKVSWFDMDLSTDAYKTMRYHKRAVRAGSFHQRYPLFASCSDDGSAVVCHGRVYSDLLQNPLIVPLKVLRMNATSRRSDSLAFLHCVFHPTQPWLLAAGADGLIRLYS